MINEPLNCEVWFLHFTTSTLTANEERDLITLVTCSKKAEVPLQTSKLTCAIVQLKRDKPSVRTSSGFTAKNNQSETSWYKGSCCMVNASLTRIFQVKVSFIMFCPLEEKQLACAILLSHTKNALNCVQLPIMIKDTLTWKILVSR